MTGNFIISLDFELLWGMRDHVDQKKYGRNILGGRRAIPKILQLFEKYEIRATWATVGLLLCDSKDEMLSYAPPIDLRPRFANTKMSNYEYFDELGQSEKYDKYYFATSLVKLIQDQPTQELASHTFAHYYTMEQGATKQTFEADVKANLKIAVDKGIKLSSIVFPRNQYDITCLKVCQENNLTTMRGNRHSFAYNPSSRKKNNLIKRGARLLDAYCAIVQLNRGPDPTIFEMNNVTGSRFLRPPTSAFHYKYHVKKIKSEMLEAAIGKKDYHLWWHPHNMGGDVQTSLNVLNDILQYFNILHHEYGFTSKRMNDFI